MDLLFKIVAILAVTVGLVIFVTPMLIYEKAGVAYNDAQTKDIAALVRDNQRS